ncbi:hypothetical protein BT96DRAFT_924921, partial [Gymnopus androsaceus JB14]
LLCNLDISEQILGNMVAEVNSALNPAWKLPKPMYACEFIIIFNSLERHVPRTRGTRTRATF